MSILDINQCVESLREGMGSMGEVSIPAAQVLDLFRELEYFKVLKDYVEAQENPTLCVRVDETDSILWWHGKTPVLSPNSVLRTPKGGGWERQLYTDYLHMGGFLCRIIALRGWVGDSEPYRAWDKYPFCNGYVHLPPTHWGYGRDYQDLNHLTDVDLSYGRGVDEEWILGFDLNHSWNTTSETRGWARAYTELVNLVADMELMQEPEPGHTRVW
jgi:hypothetical protein